MKAKRDNTRAFNLLFSQTAKHSFRLITYKSACIYGESEHDTTYGLCVSPFFYNSFQK